MEHGIQTVASNERHQEVIVRVRHDRDVQSAGAQAAQGIVQVRSRSEMLDDRRDVFCAEPVEFVVLDIDTEQRADAAEPGSEEVAAEEASAPSPSTRAVPCAWAR